MDASEVPASDSPEAVPVEPTTAGPSPTLLAIVQFPRRVLLLLAAFLLSHVVTFAIFSSAPGSLEDLFLNSPTLTRDQRETLRDQLGFDQPGTAPLVAWIGHALTGDWGISFINAPRPVSDVVAERLFRTLGLLGGGIVVGMVLTAVASDLAVLLHKQGEASTPTRSVLLTIGKGFLLPQVTIPLFALSLLLIMVLSYLLGLFPLGKLIDPNLWRTVPAGLTVNAVFARLLIFGGLGGTLVVIVMIATSFFQPVIRLIMRPLAAVVILGASYGLAVVTAGEISRYVADLLWHSALPTLAVAIMPAALNALLLTRELTVQRERKGPRVQVAAALKWLAMVFRQIGGLLGLVLVVETLFSYPGLGLTLVNAASLEDVPMTMGVLSTGAFIVLGGLLLSELLLAVERLVRADETLPQRSPVSEEPEVDDGQRKKKRSLGLALLAIPLLCGLLGLIQPVLLNTVWSPMVYDPVVGYDFHQIVQPAPPSGSHPLGTDPLGRDILSQLMAGGFNSLTTALAAGLIALLVALPAGILAGFLDTKQTWWGESLADLALLPADALLMLPVFAIFIAALAVHDLRFIGTVALVGIAIAGRAAWAIRSMWWSTPPERSLRLRFVNGLAALGLGAAYVALHVVTTAGFLGLRNARITLGLMLNTTYLAGYLLDWRRWWLILPATVAIWLLMLAFFVGMDFLLSPFPTRDPEVHLLDT